MNHPKGTSYPLYSSFSRGLRRAMRKNSSRQSRNFRFAQGRPVEYNDPQRRMVDETVQVIDWNVPANNDFFLASQFWVSGPVSRSLFRPSVPLLPKVSEK